MVREVIESGYFTLHSSYYPCLLFRLFLKYTNMGDMIEANENFVLHITVMINVEIQLMITEFLLGPKV
jgi:hypothetical protein